VRINQKMSVLILENVLIVMCVLFIFDVRTNGAGTRYVSASLPVL
jgi:hypothetical protein